MDRNHPHYARLVALHQEYKDRKIDWDESIDIEYETPDLQAAEILEAHLQHTLDSTRFESTFRVESLCDNCQRSILHQQAPLFVTSSRRLKQDWYDVRDEANGKFVAWIASRRMRAFLEMIAPQVRFEPIFEASSSKTVADYLWLEMSHVPQLWAPRPWRR
jgi:hypothetical protein